ncbi:MAG: choice-of-anchor V domain-containing protein, partial [Myxococcota bacterium]
MNCTTNGLLISPRSLTPLALAALLGLLPLSAHAESTGIGGRSGQQSGVYCSQCHNNDDSLQTVTTISGPNRVAASSINTYTVTLTANGNAVLAGFNASADQGTLSTTDSNVKVVDFDGRSEVTHVFPPIEFSNGVARYTFR